MLCCAVLCCRFTRQGCTSRGVETVYRLFLRIPAPTEDLGACAHGHRQEGGALAHLPVRGGVRCLIPIVQAAGPLPAGMAINPGHLGTCRVAHLPPSRTRYAVFAYYLSRRPANYAEGQRATTCRFPLGARVALSRAGRCEFGVVLRAHFWI